ncbi:MAG TPA: DUF393 domain-containing protein [Chloroflexota bacterium]|nr:DUF393 domain-containing protein [Chloroflexota bacterium]
MPQPLPPTHRPPDPVALRALLGPHAVLVVFDGWCGICTRAVDWVRQRDADNRVLALPNQTPGLCELLGLSRAQVDRSIWAFAPDGRAYAAAAAMNRVLRELPGWRWLGRLLDLPPLLAIATPGYYWFGAHRHRFARFGASPACARPGAHCTRPE